MKINQEEKEIDQGLKLLAKSSFIIFIGLFLSKIFSYAYRIIIARYFGPEVYGLFSLALMVGGWFIAVASLGLFEGLLRYVSIYRGKNEFQKIKHIWRFSLIVLFISTMTAGIILFFSSTFISINLFHNPDLIIFLQVFSFVIPLAIFSSVFLAVLKAFEKIGWYSFIFNIVLNLVKVISLILLIFLGFKSNAVIFSYVLGFLIMLLVAFFVSKYKIPEIFGKSRLKKLTKSKMSKEFFSYSWPFMFISLISSIFFWIDSFTIGYFWDVSQVGFYNAAIPIILLMSFVPRLFSQLFFPLINKEFAQKNLQVIKQLSQQVGKWIFIFNLPLFLIMIVFPGTIINFLFGQPYLVAVNALQILAIGSFFSSIFFISENLISMIGKSKLLLTNIIITSIINLILNFILVPKYGINGAAISTTIVTLLLNALLVIEAKYYTSIVPIRRKMIRISLASLIPLFAIFYLKQLIGINFISLVLVGSFFILTYLLIILITGCLDKNDFMIMKTLRDKIFKN